MENLIIAQTKQTPQIEFMVNDNYLRISGESYPENAMEVFQPLIERIEQYFKQENRKLKVDLRVEWQNTSSSKMMYEIINRLSNYHLAGHSVKLAWFYVDGDMEMLENCEMFLEDVSFPYEIVAEKD
ncbi:MAG: DUF1987 domain-containing protein [Candidatus Cloacimonetes bacterium]|nr:DUF1987 domain-containing protein [Candidatus Cloacimonadota bacterium]